MEKKIKVTYLQSGMPVQAKIFMIYGWHDFSTQLSNQGIMDETVIKIEVILESSAINTFDTTEGE